MTRWKRVGLSLLSAIIAEILVALAICIPSGRHLLFEHLFGFVYFASFLVIAGWLLALPVLLFFKRIDGGYFVLLALLGFLIGPLIDLGMHLWAWAASPTSAFTIYMPWMYTATAISGLATALYLTALKVFSRPTPTPSTPTN